MKRSLFIIIFISLAAICWGAPPRLASETIFSRTEIKTDGHKFISNKSRDNYFRSVTAYNDKALLAEIKKQVLKDKSRASDVVEGYKILNIPNNGHTINIGFWWNANGYCHLFIQSELAAFE